VNIYDYCIFLLTIDLILYYISLLVLFKMIGEVTLKSLLSFA
jgi:hypothetical protein